MLDTNSKYDNQGKISHLYFPDCHEDPETVPAETELFQENVGTERCPQVGRSLDHQVLPVHLAPRRRDEMNIITNSFNPSKYVTVNIYIHTAGLSSIFFNNIVSVMLSSCLSLRNSE